MNNYYDTAIGKVPSEWSTELIGSFFDIQQGKQLSAATRKGDNVRKFLRTANIFWGKIDFSNLDEMHFSDSDTARMGLKQNDLLICEGGDIGRTAICKVDLPDVYYQNHLHRLRPKDDKVVPEFFMYWMWYAWNLTDYYGGAGNKTTIPNLSKAKLSGLHFAKPSKDEQIKIAYILSTLKKAIQKQEEIINTTAALKKSLLNKLFIEGTKGEPLKQTEIGMIPESWELKKLGKLCNVSSGGTPSREVSEYWTGGTIPWVKTGEINYTLITETSEKITQLGLDNSSAKMFPAGTLLMAMYGQGITRGRVALLGIDATLNQACAAIIPFSEKEISSNYLYRYFEYQYEYIREFGHGANQKNLSGTIIKSIPVAYPKDEKEQETIFTSIDAIQNKLEHHKRKKEVYENLFRTLLNDLMTGAIRVNEVQFNSKSSPDFLLAENTSKKLQHEY